ncbi:hypothetical protein ACFVAF_17690 [Streptomyces sp. NPDC057596]|uniref:hypothetical protein n=1 Tax=Streptomyces sp. NPDC057596 TaxID=3346178 RepID=UPI00367787AE
MRDIVPSGGRSDLTHHEWTRLESLLPCSGRPVAWETPVADQAVHAPAFAEPAQHRSTTDTIPPTADRRPPTTDHRPPK